MPPMKIALVCPYDFSRPGGVKSHIVSLSKYLTIIGHQVKIIAPNINASSVRENNVYFFGRNRSVHLGGTKIDVNIALGKEKRTLKAFLKDEQFDIVHYHTIWNPFLLFQVRKYSNYSQTRQIATFHDTPKNRLIGKWIMPLAARWIFPFLDEIISVSETQAQFISRFSKQNIHIIPNGIDLDEVTKFDRMKNQRNDHYFQIMFLGRLEPRKGAMHALKAFHQLKPRYPELKLIIAGDGDGRTEIEQYVKDYDLVDSIELKGFVDDKTKYKLLKASDLYIAPALYGESFGIVLLESMAMGTPMAGYANEGYKNVLTPQQMEGFAPPGDVDGLIKCIEKMIPSAKRRTLSIHGRKEVQKFNWGDIAALIAHKVYFP